METLSKPDLVAILAGCVLLGVAFTLLVQLAMRRQRERQVMRADEYAHQIELLREQIRTEVILALEGDGEDEDEVPDDYRRPDAQ